MKPGEMTEVAGGNSMELVKKKIRMNRPGKTVADQFAIDDDYNVPDTKKDVARVVSAEGTIRIDDTRRAENYLRVSGKLFFRVLYVTDESEPSLASLEGRIPFEEMVYMDQNAEGEDIVKAQRTEFTASLIHSRKLALRAVAELAVHTEQIVNEETTVDVSDAENLYKKQHPLQLLQMHTNKRDIYRIKEEIAIPGTKENIGSLIWTDVRSRRLDTRLGADALLVNGELQVFCFYESMDGKIDWVEQNVPYEGRVECVGADEGMYHHVYDELADVNVEVRMDGDGEMRMLGIEAALELRILVYEEEKTEILEDVYSLEAECMPERADAVYEELIMQNHAKSKLSERLNLPELKEEILQICHSSGSLQTERMEIVPEGIQIDGVLHVSFLYVKANDVIPFDVWQGIVPFSFLMEMKESSADMCYDMTCAVEQLETVLAGSDEVEIKAVLAFRSFLRRQVPVSVITKLEFRPFDAKQIAERPGIIGYIVKKGDTLWDLARRYCTTSAGIMKVNELTSEELKEGDKILIFKENVGIL